MNVKVEVGEILVFHDSIINEEIRGVVTRIDYDHYVTIISLKDEGNFVYEWPQLQIFLNHKEAQP